MTRPTSLPRRRRPPVFDGDFTDAQSITDAFAALTAVPPAAKQAGPGTVPLATLRGLPRYQPPQQPPAPRREPDCAIFAVLSDGTMGLMCGADRWRRHIDPETLHARRQFDALRASAYAAGWRLDGYGRWCCPRCTADPAYTTPRPVQHYSEGAGRARLGALKAGRAGDREAEAALLDDEYWRRVHAENVVFRDVNGSAQAGKHHRQTVTP